MDHALKPGSRVPLLTVHPLFLVSALKRPRQEGGNFCSGTLGMLHRVVEQRTRELAAANDELRREIAERKIVEEKLRQDERELRHITDAIPQAIAVLDPQGTILYVNQWILEYSGLSLEELLTPSSEPTLPSRGCGAYAGRSSQPVTQRIAI